LHLKKEFDTPWIKIRLLRVKKKYFGLLTQMVL
jgi:hypothetical protein